MPNLYAYCSLADVEGTTGFKYDAETHPSRTEARNIVEGVAAEIDGVLEATGYSLPIASSATRTLSMLRHYNILGAAYRCWHADVRGPESFPAVVSWETDFREFITRLEEGKTKLPGVGSDDTRSTIKLRSINITGGN